MLPPHAVVYVQSMSETVTYMKSARRAGRRPEPPSPAGREGKGLQGATKSRAVGAISYASQINVMVVVSAAQKPIPAGTVEARRFSQPKLMNIGHELGTDPA